MKENIHPDYHTITVVMTDGTKYETRSTWGKAGDVLQLDVDPKTHPAWVGGINLRKTGQMEKFTNKFAFLDKGAAAPAAKKEAKKEEKPATAKPEASKKEAKKDEKPAEAKKADGGKKEAKKEEKQA
jgi:large subunit ribosomal protein L31